MKTAVKLDAITPGVIAIPAIEVFRERCEARAILVEACLFDLQDAVDGFQEAAVASGLVEEVGEDAVQKMMAEAFAKFSSRDENSTVPNFSDVGRKSLLSRRRDNSHDVVRNCRNVTTNCPDVGTIPRSRGATKATLQAADYLVKLKDPARLKAWLAQHTRAERDAIIKHIRRTR